MFSFIQLYIPFITLVNTIYQIQPCSSCPNSVLEEAYVQAPVTTPLYSAPEAKLSSMGHGEYPLIPPIGPTIVDMRQGDRWIYIYIYIHLYRERDAHSRHSLSPAKNEE